MKVFIIIGIFVISGVVAGTITLSDHINHDREQNCKTYNMTLMPTKPFACVNRDGVMFDPEVLATLNGKK